MSADDPQSDIAREPLSYRAPRDDLDERKLRSVGGMSQFLIGFVTCGGCVAFAGFVWFFSLYPRFPHDMSGKIGPTNIAPMAVMMTLGVGAAAGVYELVRRRESRPFFVLGLLCGATVLALIEGLCFGQT